TRSKRAFSRTWKRCRHSSSTAAPRRAASLAAPRYSLSCSSVMSPRFVADSFRQEFFTGYGIFGNLTHPAKMAAGGGVSDPDKLGNRVISSYFIVTADRKSAPRVPALVRHAGCFTIFWRLGVQYPVDPGRPGPESSGVGEPSNCERLVPRNLTTRR